MGPWVCQYDGYKHLKKGDICYPTSISDYYLVIHIDEQIGKIYYLKERFKEAYPFQYDPNQTGDREDDI